MVSLGVERHKESAEPLDRSLEHFLAVERRKGSQAERHKGLAVESRLLGHFLAVERHKD